jgi:hypothetical protein
MSSFCDDNSYGIMPDRLDPVWARWTIVVDDGRWLA